MDPGHAPMLGKNLPIIRGEIPTGRALHLSSRGRGAYRLPHHDGLSLEGIVPVKPSEKLLERDLGRRPDRADEARHDVERALPRAPLDVVLEPVLAEVARALARSQPGDRVREARREPRRGGGGVRVVAAE